MKICNVFASTQLRITRLRKYPIDPKAYLGRCLMTPMSPCPSAKNDHFCQVRLTTELSDDIKDNHIQLSKPNSPPKESHSDTVSIDPDKILNESSGASFTHWFSLMTTFLTVKFKVIMGLWVPSKQR